MCVLQAYKMCVRPNYIIFIYFSSPLNGIKFVLDFVDLQAFKKKDMELFNKDGFLIQ